MSETNLLKTIASNFIIKRIFSFLPIFINYSAIKYNKNLQKKLDINFINTILNYQTIVLSKKDLISKLKKSFLEKEYHSIIIDGINDENFLFLIKYKGFKINYFRLPIHFDSMKNRDKISLLQNNEYSFKYKLSNRNIKLIDLINKFRANNNKNQLIYNRVENITDYFEIIDSNNNKNILFTFSFGTFKNKLSKNDENVTKKLLIDELKYIMILEKEKIEYIFIYSIAKIIKPHNFHLINNIIPIFNKNMSSVQLKRFGYLQLKRCFLEEGYQIFSLKDNTLIGVLEGPPDTPYQNGYFLFQIIFPDDFPLAKPRFTFISKIFHPNISENGFVSCDILRDNWNPALSSFTVIIPSIQSLLDDPNPDDFLNEEAARLYKEDKKIYDETVRQYTSLFSNYSKFLEDIKNMNIKVIINEKGKPFNALEEK